MNFPEATPEAKAVAFVPLFTRYERAAIRVINYKDASLYRYFKAMAANLRRTYWD